MKKNQFIAFLLGLVSCCVAASGWEFIYKAADASYSIYGNSLGEPVAPSANDKKIAFEIRSTAAREIFEAIGPDKSDECSSESGVRFRSKDDGRIACIRSKTGEYSCYFGFDLITGKSSGGSIC